MANGDAAPALAPSLQSERRLIEVVSKNDRHPIDDRTIPYLAAAYESFLWLDLSSAGIRRVRAVLKPSRPRRNARRGHSRVSDPDATKTLTSSSNFAVQRHWQLPDIIEKALPFRAAARQEWLPSSSAASAEALVSG